MSTRVFYDSWQLQCCGEAFAVGDVVEWTVIPAFSEFEEQLGAEGEGIEWYEEHHQAERKVLDRIEGTVTGIRAIRQRFTQQHPERKVLVPVPGDAFATELDSANGWESESPDPARPDYKFTGYVVTLD